VKLALAMAAALCCSAAGAADVFVPAHRTRDGSLVPPNVAPNSGGSYLARRPGKRTVAAPAMARAPTSPLASPLFVNAQPIRR
jgi:hypothetical protein